ncbi:MAG: RNA pyrophosphohydrolase [Leptospiraceae bacterium]|nr:RNA pyrophosphohydrolase [Leptospiraceae bacterium]
MKPYRKNVGMVVFNAEGKVLMGERLHFRGSWQFPQGGIDKKEDPREAAKRELYEEVGIKDGEFVYEHPEWLSYDFPPDMDLHHLKKYKGQIQKWFLIYWNHGVEECDLDQHEREFQELKFIPINNCMDTIVGFKKDVYKKVVEEFAPKIKEYLEVQSHFTIPSLPHQ